MLILSPLERFDFSKPLDWPHWKQNFRRFRLATKLHKEEGAVQVSALIYTMGREAKFDEHFVPKRNIIHERARFHHRNQKQGVSVESFVRSLSNGGNSVRGPGYWTMNTSLLDDDEYIKDITAQIPSSLTEGRKELSDNRSICHWLKYNIRVHAIQIQIRVHADTISKSS